MKRIVTVQDISCLGKCSLTVALPIISAMGVECAILPTAVLSTHTMFSGFTCCDLTSEFRPIAAHWKQEKLGFDGKSVINPRQIAPLHKCLVPGEKDLRKAYAIMDAIAEANAKGSGVASLNGKMIDKPVVIRAQRLIALAEADKAAAEEE